MQSLCDSWRTGLWNVFFLMQTKNLEAPSHWTVWLNEPHPTRNAMTEPGAALVNSSTRTWKCSAAPRWWMPNLSWCRLSGRGYANKSSTMGMAPRISALWWYVTVPLQEFLQAFRRVSLPTSWQTRWLTFRSMLAVCWFTRIGQGSQKEGHWSGGYLVIKTRSVY